MELRLRPLRGADETQAIAAHAELTAEGHEFLVGWRPGMRFAKALEAIADARQGVGVPAGRVATTFLFAEVGAELVGRASIRHALTPWLERYGGHIGYSVRPGHRGRGHATEMLRQSLIIARAVGVDAVLVTCDDDNLASATVIERCGGVLAERVEGPHGGSPKRRYWIP